VVNFKIINCWKQELAKTRTFIGAYFVGVAKDESYYLLYP
jgi:hypothetical protein